MQDVYNNPDVLRRLLSLFSLVVVSTRSFVHIGSVLFVPFSTFALNVFGVASRIFTLMFKRASFAGSVTLFIHPQIAFSQVSVLTMSLSEPFAIGVSSHRH